MPSEKEIFGEVKKCPGCGIIVGSFAVACPGCGTEFREIPVSHTVEKFYSRLSEIPEEKKEEYITNFVVPNTKEEILDFLTMASSQIEPLSHSNFIIPVNETKITRRNAIWVRKMEQIRLRASISMKEDRAGYQVVSSIVDGVKRIGDDNKRKSKETKLGCLALIVVVIIIGLVAKSM
ncbi:MAG: hypothetical protein ACKO6Q_04995 [Bacteroidota bacterium]